MLEDPPEVAAASELEKELLELDLNSLTPLEALQILAVWQQKAAKEDGHGTD
jgi:hypothetical protein